MVLTGNLQALPAQINNNDPSSFGKSICQLVKIL